jgi:phenylacetate-CoA ligase
MGKEYRRTLSFLESSVGWSEKEWNVYQTKKIRDLMFFCHANVPYYQSLFEQLDINPKSEDIWCEFYKIPPIDKEVVSKDVSRFLPVNGSISKFYSATTGGTTGKPMKTFYESASFSKEWAYKCFFWNLSVGYRPTDKKATFRGVSDLSFTYEINPIYSEIRFSPFHLDAGEINLIVDKMLSYRPVYIHGYPSALEQLANYFLDKGIVYEGIKAAILISENIHPRQKVIIEKAFDCKIYSFYGHSERLIFASMGSDLKNFYPHPAYGITEIIDDNGVNINTLGQVGELVGTGFINNAMPLLRFKTGDYSNWATRDKDCGMPALGNIKGRWHQEYLIGKNGLKVSLTSLNMHSDFYSKVRQMQYIQNIPGLIILNIVRENTYTINDQNAIANEYNEKLGDQFLLEFQYVDFLQKTQAGKIPFLIQKVV